MDAITLRSAGLRADILPSAGGGLARLDWLGGPAGSAPLPVFRPYEPAPGAAPPTPSQLACFPMLPWANRIGGAGFVCEGRKVALEPNRPGEPCPIHGDGWQYPWQVRQQDAGMATLVLDRRDGAPFSYRARLHYALDGATLNVSLEVLNTGAQAMPFGIGLHPWLPRPAEAQLRARARTVWRSGADKLPAEETALPPEWDFNAWRAVPKDGVDNVFCGWDGGAQIAWPQSGIALDIQADMRYYILYAPPGAGFFCFEPVDHAINAHNLPGGAAHNGLTLLAPGQALQRRVSFSVAPCAA